MGRTIMVEKLDKHTDVTDRDAFCRMHTHNPFASAVTALLAQGSHGKDHVNHAPTPMTSSLPQNSAMHSWAQGLRLLLSNQPRANETDWQLQGHAVLLESDALEEVTDLLEDVANIAGMPLHVFAAANVVEQFLPWIEELPVNAPALVYLMPGEWMDPSPPGTELEQSACAAGPCADTFLRAVQGVIRGLGPRPVVLVTAGRGFGQLCSCLRQLGYFDRRIRVPEWSADVLTNDFLHELGTDLADESLYAKPERLGALLKAVFPDRRRRNLTVLALKRLARRQQRRVGFSDLVQMATQGTSEDTPMPTDPATRYRTAVHEAGHALVSHLDSAAMSAPAFCTALKSRDSHGQMAASFEAQESRGDDLTVAHIRHKIRTHLAGLAAEHRVLGAESTSAAGSGNDLDEATRLTAYLLGSWGFSPDNSTPSMQASNLATVVNDSHPADNPRIARMTRQYLQAEYMKVTDLLSRHRAYLDSIVDALCTNEVLIQEDFERLWAECADNNSSTRRGKLMGSTCSNGTLDRVPAHP